MHNMQHRNIHILPMRSFYAHVLVKYFIIRELVYFWLSDPTKVLLLSVVKPALTNSKYMYIELH